MITTKLSQFLNNQHVDYSLVQHSLSFTAQETAERSRISGLAFAKTVIVRRDDQLAMMVMPAPFSIDFETIHEALQCSKVDLAYEFEFEERFPDCEAGAMPPFGNLYGMEVWVAAPLTEMQEICFNAGDHRELVKMRYQDFERLVKPNVFEYGWCGATTRRKHPHARFGRTRH